MRHTNKDAPIHTMQTVVDRARRTRLGERAPRLETLHNETRTKTEGGDGLRCAGTELQRSGDWKGARAPPWKLGPR